MVQMKEKQTIQVSKQIKIQQVLCFPLKIMPKILHKNMVCEPG